MNMQVIFVSLANFFGPLWTSKNEALGPQVFKDLVHERFLISKYSNISYLETADLTPTERKILLGFITEDLEKKVKAEQQWRNKN